MEAAVGERVGRGWVSVYAVAFALLLGSGAAIAFAGKGLLSSTKLLWLSIGLSAAAILAAAVSLALKRR